MTDVGAEVWRGEPHGRGEDREGGGETGQQVPEDDQGGFTPIESRAPVVRPWVREGERLLGRAHTSPSLLPGFRSGPRFIRDVLGDGRLVPGPQCLGPSDVQGLDRCAGRVKNKNFLLFSQRYRPYTSTNL